MKICSKCNTSKELSEFYKRNDGKNGYRNQCKICRSISLQAYRQTNREKLNAKSRSYYNANREDIISHKKVYNVTYRKNNSETIKANRDRYYKENREAVLERNSLWSKNNRSLSNAGKAKYRAAQINRTPNWITEYHKAEIKNFYSIAHRLGKLFNAEYHVDHIIPLQGKDVSGLHVPWNLQILPASVNMSKGNNYE